MARLFYFAATLVVGLSPLWSDDQAKEPPKAPARVTAPKVPAAKVNNKARGGGVPKAGAKALPTIPKAPNAQIQRFLRMTPQEREIYIDKAPVPNQQRLRNLAEHWDSLPQEERDRQLQLFESLSRLPRDKQDLVNQRLTEFQQLGLDRRVAIRRAYQMLSEKPEEERQPIIDSPAFKERFTPMEQQIITDLVKYYPNPRM